MKYLDPAALAQIRNLRLPLRRLAAEGTLGGSHRSAHKGLSQEFAEHREYVPGDELKFLDWKVYARSDRYLIRQFVEEKSLRTYCLLDASGSMGYRDRGAMTKFEYAARWALALSYLVLKEKDQAGLALFGATLRELVPPSESLGHLHLLDAALERTRPEGSADYAASILELSRRLPRRSLLIVFTDLLGRPEEMRRSLRALRAQKHELLVLQVLDPSEVDLPWEGQVLVQSLEGGAPVAMDAGQVRRAYRERFEHEQRLNESAFREAEIGYRVLMSDQPWIGALSRFLNDMTRTY